MSDNNDGGPAFPQSVTFNQNGEAVTAGMYYADGPGMSLRAWFSGQALCGWAAGRNKDTFCDTRHEFIADACVKYADAMIRRLEEKS